MGWAKEKGHKSKENERRVNSADSQKGHISCTAFCSSIHSSLVSYPSPSFPPASLNFGKLIQNMTSQTCVRQRTFSSGDIHSIPAPLSIAPTPGSDDLNSLDTPVSQPIQLQTMPSQPPLTSHNSMSISIASSSSSTHSHVDESPPLKRKDAKHAQDDVSYKLQTWTQAHPWLMGWNHEDWWPCWIGLFLFTLVSISVHYGIPAAHFAPWSANPFESLAGKSNLALLVLAPLQGLLVFLALWSVNTSHWRQFHKGFLVIYSLAFLGKWLAAQKNIKSASLGDSIWAILFGAVLRNIMAGAPLPDGRSKPLPAWLKVAQQTELYIAISLVLLW